MTDASPALTARDQDKVWDYYQTDGIAIFDDAVPRLAGLFREAQRGATGQTLRTLNIGVGNAWLEQRCQQAGWDSWGLDPNPRAAEGLRAKGIHGVTAGIEAMPLPEGHFDVVFSSEVFEHLLDDLLLAGLREIRRVLRPDGRLIGTVPCNEQLALRRVVCPACDHVHHAFGHHQSFSQERLASLFRAAGLAPVFFRTRSFPPFARRDMKGKLKSAVWYALGRFGAQAADAKIMFVARPVAEGRRR